MFTKQTPKLLTNSFSDVFSDQWERWHCKLEGTCCRRRGHRSAYRACTAPPRNGFLHSYYRSRHKLDTRYSPSSTGTEHMPPCILPCRCIWHRLDSPVEDRLYRFDDRSYRGLFHPGWCRGMPGPAGLVQLLGKPQQTSFFCKSVIQIDFCKLVCK